MSINSTIPQDYAANVPAIDTADGTVVTPGRDANPPTGCALTSAHTYVFPLGGTNSQLPGTTPLVGAHVKWDAVFAGTITIEESFFPAKPGGEVGGGRDDVKDWDITNKGNWLKQDPSTAYISVTSTDATTGGATVTNATIAVAGGTAGGAILDMGNVGARRVRVKVVATTGGVVRVAVNGKVAAG